VTLKASFVTENLSNFYTLKNIALRYVYVYYMFTGELESACG